MSDNNTIKRLIVVISIAIVPFVTGTVNAQQAGFNPGATPDVDLSGMVDSKTNRSEGTYQCKHHGKYKHGEGEYKHHDKYEHGEGTYQCKHHGREVDESRHDGNT